MAALRCRATFPREGGFQYMSPEQAEALERELAEARERGLEEYAALKALLLKRTWRFGTLFALYLLLSTSAEVRPAGEGRSELLLRRPLRSWHCML